MLLLVLSLRCGGGEETESMCRATGRSNMEGFWCWRMWPRTTPVPTTAKLAAVPDREIKGSSMFTSRVSHIISHYSYC